MSRHRRVASWLRAKAQASIAASLFWLFTIAAISLAGMGAIVTAAIVKGVDAATAALIGTALPLLAAAAVQVVKVLGAALGVKPPPEE